MIHDGLVETLLARTIINGATQVLAEFSKIDNSFRAIKLKELCTVSKVTKGKTGVHTFELVRLDNKEVVTVTSKDILLIDGMDSALLAKAFDINPDGNKKVLGKRRGRPRNIDRLNAA